MTETFYDVLGVSEDATTDEIQSAYRERLKEIHPDVSDADNAEKETQTLIEARDVLVDEEERRKYDSVGHAAYVGDSAAGTAEDTTAADSATTTGDTAQGRARDRSGRERRARQRVNRDRRQRRTEATTEPTGETTETASGGSTAGATGRQRPGGKSRHVGTDTTVGGDEQSYSVRNELSQSREFGPILPSGHRLTLFGIFFILYPVLLFSTLLPAFPLFVNIIVGLCTLLTIGYLQSMPRIALLVFGNWSVVAVIVMPLIGIPLLSWVGLSVLAGTVFPFGFSVLTASALRF